MLKYMKRIFGTILVAEWGRTVSYTTPPPLPTPTFYSLFSLMEIIMDIIFFIFSDFLDVKYTKTLNMNTVYIYIINKFDNIKK